MQAPKLPGAGWFIAWFALCAIGSVSVIGFLLYLAWRLVEHFTK